MQLYLGVIVHFSRLGQAAVVHFERLSLGTVAHFEQFVPFPKIIYFFISLIQVYHKLIDKKFKIISRRFTKNHMDCD